MQGNRQITITQREDGYVISFNAMASPCEVIIESKKLSIAEHIGQVVADEVWRIEDKYSRYNTKSLCSQINNSKGNSYSIDNETFLLLSFAQQCHELSDGLFDITSGVLRQVWCFDGSDNIPSKSAVKKILPYIGWDKIQFDEQQIILPEGMEIDFGGIGKEYAVDKAILLIKNLTSCPTLVNLGGDLAASASRHNGHPWQVGIEHPGFIENKLMIVSLYQGALATSGDAKRFLLNAGKRYSHILNAQTGWPIEHAPRSMTVAAPQCIQAGILATLSLMQGCDAERFLKDQEVKYWAIR